jgi:hypothetical protein
MLDFILSDIQIQILVTFVIGDILNFVNSAVI